MPGRYLSDTSTHCYTTTITEPVDYFNFTYYAFSAYPLSITPFGGAYTISLMSGEQQLITFGHAADSLVISIDSITPGAMQCLKLVTDGGTTTYGAHIISGGVNVGSSAISYSYGGITTIYFHPTTPIVTLVIGELFPSGLPHVSNTLNLRGIYLPRFDSAVLEDVVTSVCNEDRYHYGFNGQMKDNEWAGIGNYLDFKARGYFPREVRFPVPDPKAASFPYKSPFVAFSGNPIIFTDPSGRTDFYFNGKWKGSDGRNNGLIGILSDKGVARQVTSATKDGHSLPDFGELKNGTSTSQLTVIHRDILSLSLNALYTANEKGSNREYSYGMKKNPDGGGYSKVYENEGSIYSLTQPGKANGGIFTRDIDVTIHSHPTGTEVSGNKVGFSDASKPTPDNGFGAGDGPLFSHHDMNIIVGKNGAPSVSNGTVEDNRSSFINVYGNSTKRLITISEDEAGKIMTDQSKRTNSQEKAPQDSKK